MLDIVPFTLDHLFMIMEQSLERELWRSLSREDWIEDWSLFTKGPAITGLIDGTPIGCGGVIPVWPGLAEGWVAFNHSACRQHTLSVLRAVARFLKEVGAARNLRRIQAHVDATLPPTSLRWLDILGFQYEHSLPLYGPKGQTYHLYAWFPCLPLQQNK